MPPRMEIGYAKFQVPARVSLVLRWMHSLLDGHLAENDYQLSYHEKWFEFRIWNYVYLRMMDFKDGLWKAYI